MAHFNIALNAAVLAYIADIRAKNRPVVLDLGLGHNIGKLGVILQLVTVHLRQEHDKIL